LDKLKHVLQELNQMRLDAAGDPEVAARINSFEMAFRMQVVAPITAPYQSALRRLSTLVKQ